MSAKHQSLMTQYLEGKLVSRELNDMLNDYAAESRFERELSEQRSDTSEHESKTVS